MGVDTLAVNNRATLISQCRDILARLGRNDAFARWVADAIRVGIPEAEVLSVFRDKVEVIPTGGNVTQDTQDTQEPQGTQDCSKKLNETEGNSWVAFEPEKLQVASVVPYHLTLSGFIRWAYDEYVTHKKERLSQSDCSWESPIFFFVRYVRGHPELANMKATKALIRIADAFKRMMPRQNQRDCPWRVYFNIGKEDAEAEFIDAWDSIRHIPGRSPLENAIASASRHTLISDEDRGAGYARFVSIAGYLQAAVGHANIVLPCHLLAEKLSVTHVTIGRYRQWAKSDGYLREMKAHTFHPQGRDNKATEFRFNLSKVQWPDCSADE